VVAEAADFLDECKAIDDLLASFSEADFAEQTAFKGWSVTDVVGHLHVYNQAAFLSLTDEVACAAFLAQMRVVREAGGTITDGERVVLKDLRGRALATAWRSFAETLAEAFDKADGAKRVPWGGQLMSARSSISARLMESWAHAQAIYDQRGIVRQSTDRIRSIVVLGVNTYGWTFKNAGDAPPEPKPYVSLVAPSGALWTFGEPSAADRVEGAAEDFCQVVTQVRNIADVTLTVVGDSATQWMARAQCFAGPAHPPPAPGTRFTRKLAGA